MHKIIITETDNVHKLFFEKESFFEVGIIPKNSTFKRYIEKSITHKKDAINFKEVLQQVTDENLMKRGRLFYTYVKNKYKKIKDELLAA